MLTSISTAKPSRESGVIQRNALQSQTFLHPEVEIVLLETTRAAECARKVRIAAGRTIT